MSETEVLDKVRDIESENRRQIDDFVHGSAEQLAKVIDAFPSIKGVTLADIRDLMTKALAAMVADGQAGEANDKWLTVWAKRDIGGGIVVGCDHTVRVGLLGGPGP